jgi:ribonucleotide reductase beta subunit family protein with ferritin-like domain
MTTHSNASETFPPYHLLDAYADQTLQKTQKLERLYNQTQEYAWDATTVLNELVKKHGGITLAEEKKEAMGQVFTVLLWGELAAWNVAADLARALPDVNAKMAATGQVFDEARHFRVLRDYLARAGVPLPKVNPYGRRLLARLLETSSLLQKLYGMQLLVEALALAIFKELADSNVEPVLTDLLRYVERDEARHVALGVLYLPTLTLQASAVERAKNWAFNVELFLLTVAGGQMMDKHWRRLGIDHRRMAINVHKTHQQLMRQMALESGIPVAKLRGIYGLSQGQHDALVDFLHPVKTFEDLSPLHRHALAAFDRAVHRGAEVWG